MKKIYMTPTINVETLNTGIQLLAGSPLEIGYGEGDVNPAEADAREFDEDFDDDYMDEEEI